MKRVVIVPVGWPVGLHECPPGLFCQVGKDGPDSSALGLKTEYRTEKGNSQAYVVASGESWWGGNYETAEAREAQLVMACDVRVEEVEP